MRRCLAAYEPEREQEQSQILPEINEVLEELYSKALGQQARKKRERTNATENSSMSTATDILGTLKKVMLEGEDLARFIERVNSPSKQVTDYEHGSYA